MEKLLSKEKIMNYFKSKLEKETVEANKDFPAFLKHTREKENEIMCECVNNYADLFNEMIKEGVNIYKED